jgi:hypothetical protein
MDALIYGYSNLVTVPTFIEEPIALQPPILLVESEADKTARLNAEIGREEASAKLQAQIEASRTAEVQKLAQIEASRIAEAQKLAQIEAQKQAGLNSPIIIVPPSYVAPPLITGGGGGGGGGGSGGAVGGGGASPKPSNNTVAKPSFLKKNFIPLLLVTGAIFVFIKKPIK